ncbi:hypothetical protein HYE68_007650 [Fusarium pseudograminearum]|nr:hypothetical protein HYE68_007650 [Fusarium pseudograminearum]
MTITAEAERPTDLDPDLKAAATATATATTTTERHAPTTEESDLQAESEGDFPDDDSALGRHTDFIDLQHHLFTLTLGGKLYLSPLQRDDKPLGRVLDAGTGTGVWAIDFADTHTETQVLGIDLSPIQPNFLPTNLEFQVDDLEDEWTYSYKFDFVFGRMLTGSIGDWPKFFQQSFDSLNPGGWVECQDITFPCESDDGTLLKGSPIDQWCELMTEAANNFGRSAVSAKLYKQQMIDAGFINVTEVVYKWPSNRWPADPHYKELGFWCNHNIAGELSGLSMALFTKGLGWSVKEVEVFLTKVRTDMRDRRIHAWWPM